MIWNLCDRSIVELYAGIGDRAEGTMIQIGSYACANYLMYLLKELQAREYQGLEPGTYDFVVPVFPEHSCWFLDTDAFVRCCSNARQIVVNDFGMLKKLSGSVWKLRMGRLFFKDYRDQRYEEYDTSDYQGKADTLVQSVQKYGFSVMAVESDIITREYTLSLSADLEVYVHYPYRQIAVSHICEFASAGRRIEEKFVPDDRCSLQCLKMCIRSYTEAGVYLKVGKNVYDILDDRYTGRFTQKDMIISPGWFDR